MKRFKVMFLILSGALAGFTMVYAQEELSEKDIPQEIGEAKEKPIEEKSQELTGEDILKKADGIMNAPKDQTFIMELILTDKDGNERIRSARMLQKGDEKRMFKFLSPASVKGVGVLVLEDDVIYFYLPAFHRVRRIASHVKNETFMGTDFTFEDMGSITFADDYYVTQKEVTDKFYILELKPKEGKEYGKLNKWVRKKDFFPTKIEYYDKEGILWKVMTRRDIIKKGEYLVAQEVEMKDLKRNHSTKMIMSDIKFDQGLSDRQFSVRFLKRN